MPPRHACCVLSLCLRCNGHSLLLSSYLSRIGRIENPFCSACEHPSQHIFHFILHTVHFLRCSLFANSLSQRPLVEALGSCLASGAPWSSAILPSLGRGRVATTTTTTTTATYCSYELRSNEESRNSWDTIKVDGTKDPIGVENISIIIRFFNDHSLKIAKRLYLFYVAPIRVMRNQLLT